LRQIDPGKPSVAVVEGLLMYLDVGAVRGLFGGLAEVGVSELVLTWLDGDARGRAPTVDRSTLAAFRALGEPLRWAASPETVAALLTEAGYALALDDEPALRRRYLLGTPLADAPLAMIERVGCARRIEGTG
jgi:O-methyltransferase involved in polyketide biosynthesis